MLWWPVQKGPNIWGQLHWKFSQVMLVVKDLPGFNPGSIPGSGRSPGEGRGNPLHIYVYITFCLLIYWWAYTLFALWLLWIIFLEHCVPIFESLLWILLDTYLKVESPEHIVVLYLTFWETVKLFSPWLHYFTFSPVMHESSNFFTSLTTFGIFFLKKL